MTRVRIMFCCVCAHTMALSSVLSLARSNYPLTKPYSAGQCAAFANDSNHTPDRNHHLHSLNGVVSTRYWTGSTVKKIKDIKGAIDAFLSTNNASTILMFWIGSSLAEFRSDPLWAEYGMHSRVQIRETGNLRALAQGTCLLNRSDILEHKKEQFTQGFSDLVRIVVYVLFLLDVNVFAALCRCESCCLCVNTT